MIILFIILIVGLTIWWYETSDKEDVTKAEVFITYGKDKFREIYGEKELQKILKRK